MGHFYVAVDSLKLELPRGAFHGLARSPITSIRHNIVCYMRIDLRLKGSLGELLYQGRQDTVLAGDGLPSLKGLYERTEIKESIHFYNRS